MKIKVTCTLFTFLLVAIGAKSAQSQIQTSVPPNIIYILADDLGYGELGAYGQQKIETPHIDELARNGMRFTQHYAGSPVCAPSRYMLLTGKHPGNAYIRANSNRPTPASFSYADYENLYKAMFEHPEIEGQARQLQLCRLRKSLQSYV